MVKQAMVLGAGFGTRMMPLTKDTPKPLIKVCGISLLERILEDLVQASVEKIVINSHYQAEKIVEFAARFADRKKIEVKVLVEEGEILETGGGILNALPEFNKQPFFVVNGDTFFVKNQERNIYQLLGNAWNKNEMSCLMLMNDFKTAIGYTGNGDFELGPNNEVIFNEMKNNRPYVYTGVQIINPEIFDGYKVERIKVMKIYNEQNFKGMFGFVNPYKWFHVGRPEEVKLVEKYLIENKLS